MDERILTALMPAIGLASGLIAAYVSLQSRALLAEVRRDLAELENRLIEKMDTRYIRRSECELREAWIEKRLDAFLERKRNAASDCEAGGG
jgi:hypothetical protein